MLQAQSDLRMAARRNADETKRIAGAPSTSQGACPRAKAGEWVEVRGKQEILATLDERGRLDGMPFMPEMFRYCGQRFQVYKRAHKTCDTVSGRYTSRLLPDSVHLDLRCDGKAHDGCQAGCLIFWKEAWLKPIAENERGRPQRADGAEPHQRSNAGAAGCTEHIVQTATRDPSSGPEPRYVCQATELFDYTKPLHWWDARQYVEDYTSGNTTIKRLFLGTVYATYVCVTQARRRTLGEPGRWLYDRFQSIWGGMPYPRSTGSIPVGEPTPRHDLNLQAGDLVRVKSLDAIRATLNTLGANRSMNFDTELIPYCGRVFRVRTRVEKFVDERTGQLKLMKTPAVILDGVYCQSRYSKNRMFCPRSIYSWWREAWLERVSGSSTP